MIDFIGFPYFRVCVEPDFYLSFELSRRERSIFCIFLKYWACFTISSTSVVKILLSMTRSFLFSKNFLRCISPSRRGRPWQASWSFSSRAHWELLTCWGNARPKIEVAAFRPRRPPNPLCPWPTRGLKSCTT